MYYEYFGLKQPPFRITPDTNLFFPGANRGAILEALIYAVGNGEGIVKVVGEVGSGKTMLCRMLEQELPDRVEVVYLANPSLSPENILHVIAFELKLPVSADTPRLEVMRALQECLLARHAENRQVVVFVEEAQGMPIATLEEIRLLSNLETRQNKLLQIVLFGQPELDEKLAQPEIRQLKERITYSFQLPPFNPGDIRDYLNSRVRACGYRAAELFSPAAVHAIAQYSEGLVRRINIIADKSLLAAYADTNIQVGKGHVMKAAKDSEFNASRRPGWLTLAAAAGIGGLMVLLAAAWWYNRAPGLAARSTPPVDTAPAAAMHAGPVSGTSPVPVRETAVAEVLPADDIEVATTATAADVVPEAVPPEAGQHAVVPAGTTRPPPAVQATPMGIALQEAAELGSPGPGDGVSLPTGTDAAPGDGPDTADSPTTVQPDSVPGSGPGDTRMDVGEAVSAKRESQQVIDSYSIVSPESSEDSVLSAAELARLREVLTEELPEEVSPVAASSDLPPCELCTGIVYRYITTAESL